MSQQLLFDGIAKPEVTTPGNIFFALLPPRHVALKCSAHARAVCREHRLTAHYVPCERHHVSLHNISRRGGTPLSEIARAREAAASVAAVVGQFTIWFDHLLSFSSHRIPDEARPLVMCCREENPNTQKLFSTLGLALRDRRLPHNDRGGFTPHITLFYSAEMLPAQNIGEVDWLVTEFALVQGFPGVERYNFLGRWTLGQNGMSTSPSPVR